ncbi:hypothetical protein JWV37_10355 [Sulfurospirillum sp. T05]|uniref:Uncharacterized protein n=1 Tax=Sulfurospirillum tamanense TaxID=2813362 RepID=A0ABS2WUY2_9BACT|nr:hypothetical protein [Sulfurospirillum tamanensis]MBN2965183.1 hypothetical protein [Sulfurospirillum tamanensis]
MRILEALSLGLHFTKEVQKMDISGVQFNTTDAVAVGGLVLVGVAVIWGVRRAIGMAR